MKGLFTKENSKQNKRSMKPTMKLCVMLSFIALNTKAVAQTYMKISPDTVAVRTAFSVDTMCVQSALRINDSYDWQKRTELNEQLFREMRKPKRREE